MGTRKKEESYDDLNKLVDIEYKFSKEGTQIFLDTNNVPHLYNPKNLNEDELWATPKGKALKEIDNETINNHLYINRLLYWEIDAPTNVTITVDDEDDYIHKSYGFTDPEHHSPNKLGIEVSIYPGVSNKDIVRSLRAIAQSIEQNSQKLKKYKRRAAQIDIERDMPSKCQIKAMKIIEKALKTKVPPRKNYTLCGGRVSSAH